VAIESRPLAAIRVESIFVLEDICGPDDDEVL
jgi:hypothetical protein